MPKVNSLLEIVLFVEDIARSATFYKEVIDLPQSKDGVFVVGPGQLLLFAKQGTTDVPKQLPGGTIPTCGRLARSMWRLRLPPLNLKAGDNIC